MLLDWLKSVDEKYPDASFSRCQVGECQTGMNTITLKTNGLIDFDGKILESGLLRFFGFQIILDERYTLRSYFELLENYSLLVELNDFIPSHREQYRSCPQSGCVCDGVEYLEFSKTVEMIGSPEKRLEIYHSLKGISGNQTFEIKSIQLINLLDLPVRLGKLKHVVFGDQVDLFEFDTVFTLFEFIDGIAWELSFHSTPDQCPIRR